MTEFIPFPKIPRYNRLVTLTEKIDGTNAVIHIEQIPEDVPHHQQGGILLCLGASNWYAIRAGSRTRWITPNDDNFGFANWVYGHADALVELGPGTHHGEWWGSGIQRGYGLEKGEKRFSLFNTYRWRSPNREDVREYASADPRVLPHVPDMPPACCDVVPVLWEGQMCDMDSGFELHMLRDYGSLAAPGFPNPEGLVIYHHASGHIFKRTCLKDEQRKE